jgi:hypothetical protein
MSFINICITITIICLLIIITNMSITLKKSKLDDYRAMIEDSDVKKAMEE